MDPLITLAADKEKGTFVRIKQPGSSNKVEEKKINEARKLRKVPEYKQTDRDS